MGIEPFLFLAVLLGGFVLQALLACWEACRRAWLDVQWMRTLAGRFAGEQGLLGGRGGYAGQVAGHGVTVRTAAAALPILQEVRRLTGVWPRVRGRRVGRPFTLVAVAVPGRTTPFVASARGAIVATVSSGDPVLDQLVSFRADEVPAGLADAREPLLELLGRHPLSVVTQEAVCLVLEGAVHDLAPAVELASEVAGRLGHPSPRRLTG